MKKLVTISLTLFLAFGLMSSCEKVNSLFDVEFNADFQTQMDMQIVPSALKSGTGTFNKTETIDPLSNADFLKYKEKIKDINIVGATIEIIALNPSSIAITNCTLIVSNSNNTLSAQWNIPQMVFTLGQKITLESNQFNLLKQILNQKNPFTVQLSGTSSAPDGTFKADVIFSTKVTANPL
ncbi:MAG TPA: hypothetical protein PKE03_05020 [Bacteroidales bacterium]|nr:hypothetical protein [Bacteroidales bacterium]